MTLLYSATILISAFLLFTIQLMIGKVMLPYFGGSPSVWNTSMMFYQILLLGGYVYAHILGTRVAPRWQPLFHWALLAASLVFIRFAILPEQVTHASSAPILTQLSLMTAIVGLPFFALSATAPLMQRWFFLTQPDAGSKVYMLYATSNLGSFLALLAYPFMIEPLSTLSQQVDGWRLLQFTLVGLFVLTGLGVLRLKTAQATISAATTKASAIPRQTILYWIWLSFLPSALSLGVTMTITTDIASMPMVWVVPLALYLLTFVIAFRDTTILSARNAFFCGLAATIAYAIIAFHLQLGHSFTSMGLALLAFFLLSYSCHRTVFERRPDARHLTNYYIYLSVGGALGGIFNSLIVPVIFSGAYEFGLSLIAALVTLCIAMYQDTVKSFIRNLTGRQIEAQAVGVALIIALAIYYSTGNLYAWLIGGMLALMSAIYLKEEGRFFVLVSSILLIIPMTFTFKGQELMLQERNYFGVKRVTQENGIRHFIHGTTNHGSQIQEEKYRLTPITYYNPTGPAADIFRVAQSNETMPNTLIIGLGIGGLSCLADEHSKLTFIEIDPDVVRLAEDTRYFTFVNDCGPKETMIVGDGRLELSKLPDHSFDLLFMDAFSSDSIPFHLITEDAVKLYLQKLKSDGFLTFHISNRYFHLTPELAAIARDLGLKMRFRIQEPGVLPGSEYPYSGTIYVVMSNNDTVIEKLEAQNADWKEFKKHIPKHAWHDDYVNIIRSFMFLHELGWVD